MIIDLKPDNPWSDALVTQLRELHDHLQPPCASSPNPLHYYSMQIANSFLRAYLSKSSETIKSSYDSALTSIQAARNLLLQPTSGIFFAPLQQEILLQDLNRLLLNLEQVLTGLDFKTRRRRISDN